MKRLFGLRTAFFIVILCMNLVACSNKENAFFEGQYLYLNGEKYIEATGLYEETNTVICRTNDDFIIYEITEDAAHNYVVARSFTDQKLYVKEDYQKDKTTIEGVCFKQNTAEYIYEEEFIDTFKKMLECKEMVEIDNDKLMMYRKVGIDVYIIYPKDSVGEYCGSIIFNGVDYMYYNHQENSITLLSEEMEKELIKYNVLNE